VPGYAEHSIVALRSSSGWVDKRVDSLVEYGGWGGLSEHGVNV
jgi:hypothetical protein